MELAIFASDSNIKKLKERASGGDTSACLKLGNLYFTDEKEPDYYAAFQWYQKAALKESGAAQFNLAICYDQGLGVKTNKFEAFKWYQKAARKGVIQAKFNLAIYYKDGAEFSTESGIILLEQDISRAIDLLKSSADAGFAPAKREQAKLYLKGIGVEQNIPKTIVLLQDAARKNDPEAMSLLAQYYIENKNDDKERIIYLLKSAVQGNIPEALNTLGSYYECGIYVPQDKQLAFTYYKKAAEQGLVSAQVKLGDYFSNGNIVKLNIWEAKYWYKMAAEQNNPYAIFMLGTYADLGVGESVNKKVAARYFIRSANADFPKAQFNLGTYYAKGEGVEKDLKMALFWYRRAALQNEPRAQRELGFYYLHGIDGEEKDYDAGLNWLTLAAKNGDIQAISFMNEIKLN